ncbi:hypothetical protein L3Q82_001863 [Scortum barcoo]|uniref:Uncharacterized protein n=1 Tax=Scortum barcoo TaxID=214431 RepID=A0ACB8W4K5_9TELE|nr:hypothetical protein L3Q82_001863 [Scortum barcoo]
MSWTLGQVKRGAELVNRSPPGGELDPLAEEEVGQTWQTQTYCEGLLGTSGRALCQGGLQLPPPKKSFSQIPREAWDIESEWTMFSASIVDTGSSKLWMQGLWCLSWRQPPNPVVDTGSKGCRQAEDGVLSHHVGLWDSDAVDGYQPAKQATARALLEAKTSRLGGVRAGGELLTSTEGIVGRWKKYYFEDLLNPTDLPSSEEAEAGDSEVDSSITQAEVTEVVRKLLSGKAPGVDEIRPEYLKSLNAVGLSWLTRLCNALHGGQDLQHVLERFAAECEAAGMRISTSKSEAMVLDWKRVVCPLQVDGEVLLQVEEFRSEAKMEREIERRIGVASAVMLGRCAGPSWW